MKKMTEENARPFMTRRNVAAVEADSTPAEGENKAGEELSIASERDTEMASEEPRKSEQMETEEEKMIETPAVEDVQDVPATHDIPEEPAVEGTDRLPDEEPRAERKSAPARPGIVASKAVIDEHLVGVMSDEVAKRIKKDTEKDDENFRALKDYQRRNEIVLGVVSAAEKSENEDFVIVTMTWNDVRILVKDSVFFEPTYKFSNDYDTLNEAEKVDVRMDRATRYIGANCPVVIKDVRRLKIMSGNYEGQTEIVAVGSRTEAMKKMRDFYFNSGKFHIEENMQTTANVLNVGEHIVTVECLGVETRIDDYNLNEEYVENCADFVHVGSAIPVRIKKYYNDANGLYFAVTGRLNLGVKTAGTMSVGNKYMGQVESDNKAKMLYTIKTKWGNISVVYNAVQGHRDLDVGDEVCVTVKEIKPEGYAYGYARKI